MTYANTPTPAGEPQLMTAAPNRWNTLAIVAFILPFIVFFLGQIIGGVLGTTGGSGTGSYAQDIQGVFRAAGIVVGVQLVGYIVVVVLGHMSLLRRNRGLRGRGFGIAALVLGYLGVVITLFGLVAILLVQSDPNILNSVIDKSVSMR